MIAAVKRIVARLELTGSCPDVTANRLSLRATDLKPLRAVLAHLERTPLLQQIAEATARHLAGYDGDLVCRPAKDLRERRDKMEELLTKAGLYPPAPPEPAR